MTSALAHPSRSNEDLVEAIYAGIASPDLLERALVMALNQLGANGGNFHIVAKRDLKSTLFLGRGANYTKANIDAYLGHWRHVNIHRKLMRGAGAQGGVFLCDEHIDREMLARSAYLNEFYFPMGERWLAGAVAYDDLQYEVSLVFNRGRDQAAFGETERRFIASLLPHVRRASSLALNLANAATPVHGFAASLERSNHAAFLVDGAKRVLWRNEKSADLLLSQRAFVLRHERIEIGQSDAANRFEALLKAALDRSLAIKGAETLKLADQNASFSIEVLPASLPAGGVFGAQAAALIIVRETKLETDIGHRLRQHFGLTKAEARLAVSLAQGQSVEEVREERQLSDATLRTQLREIFSKTGVTRQGALIAKIWRLGV